MAKPSSTRALKEYLIPRISLLAWVWDANAGNRRETYDRMNGPDTHWQFASEPEVLRHQRTLDMVAGHRALSKLGSVLEIGCANGDFTTKLDGITETLAACDISELACAATRKRVPRANVFPLDILKTEEFGQYDTVIAMDLLDCVQLPWRVSKVVQRLIRATKPDGLLVISSTRLAPSVRGGVLARALGVGADYHQSMLLADSRVKLLETASFTFPRAGYPEHLISVFRRIS